MLNDGGSVSKVILAVGYTDLRRGIEGLASIVKFKYNLDPHEKNVLFLFCGTRSDRIKGLLWEGDGFLLLYKRLDQGAFSWPRTTNEAIQLTREQYMNNLSEEQLNKLDQSELIKLILSQQEQIRKLDDTLQKFMEEVVDANRRRFGRSSEAFEMEGQISFNEMDGTFSVFNAAEAVYDEEQEQTPAPAVKSKRPQGKKAADLSKLRVLETKEYYLSDDELTREFGDEGYKRLPDEIIKRYCFVPAKVGIEEIHVGVYSGKKSERMVNADFPAYLMRNSLVSPSLEAGIINVKFVNAVPFYRIEKQLGTNDIDITRQDMARWTIQTAERYLSLIYDYLHRRMYDYHILHADETPVLVNKDGRPAGSKSYMWVYRTGQYHEHPIVLYEYQRTRNASHPREFLKDFSGVCITDGYQVYHTIEKEREDLKIAGCYAHARAPI
jgi:transposase